jgi:hypothetical protein
MYANGVPKINVTNVVIALVSKLSRSALNACSEKAFVKKLLLMERNKMENNGSINKASNKMLGKTNNHFERESLLKVFINKKSRGRIPPATL